MAAADHLPVRALHQDERGGCGRLARARARRREFPHRTFDLSQLLAQQRQLPFQLQFHRLELTPHQGQALCQLRARTIERVLEAFAEQLQSVEPELIKSRGRRRRHKRHVQGRQQQRRPRGTRATRMAAAAQARFPTAFGPLKSTRSGAMILPMRTTRCHSSSVRSGR